jgi:hypothetical protein
MTIAAAEAVVSVMALYGVAGLAVAVAFVFGGIDRVTASARGSYAFRPLLLPGLILLWPLVAWRWNDLARSTQVRLRPVHPRAHRYVWSVLCILLPAVLLAGWAMRQVRVPSEAAVRIAPP